LENVWMSSRLLAPLLLIGCQAEVASHLPQVRLNRGSIDIPESRYDVTPQFASFTITNLGSDVVYLSLDNPVGDGGDLVQLSILPFTTLTPEQTRAVEVTLDPAVWRWRTGSFSPTVRVDARYFFSGQDIDEAELPSSTSAPESVSSVFEITVNFSIDCDLDDDGVDSAQCAPTCDGAAGADTDTDAPAVPLNCEPSDCRDDLPETNPSSVETCNGRDDDCDGAADEDAIDLQTWYEDVDADGHGDPDSAFSGCTRPAGRWVTIGDDCDDTRGTVHPGVAELCGDLRDNDCDTFIDETCP
jgi:hypothetical protein